MVNDNPSEQEKPLEGAGNIMRQLHESDSRGVERGREIVVRPDGTKVIRVKKRKRSYRDSEEAEKKKALNNKRFLIAACAAVMLVVISLVGLYVYRMSALNTESFASEMQVELKEAWGGEVKLSGLAMDGRVLKAGEVKIDFPEDSCLSFALFERVKAEISVASLFLGKLKGESLYADRAVIGLRPGFTKFQVPQTGKVLPFSFGRYTSPHFEVGYADEKEPYVLDRKDGAFLMTAEAYVRATKAEANAEYVLDLSQQKLRVRGWPIMTADSGSIIVNGDGIRQLCISGVVDKGDKGALFNKTRDTTSFMITGTMRLGGDFRHRNWTLEGRNVELSQIAGDTFSSFLKVRMGEQAVEGKAEMNLSFALPISPDQKRPAFQGSSGSVVEATMMRLPVFRLLSALTARHADTAMPYSSPVFMMGGFLMESNGMDRNLSLKDIAFFEQGFLGVNGNISSRDGVLSGQLEFKLPSYLADARSLPKSIRQEGRDYVISVNLSGAVSDPTDRSDEVLKELNTLIRESQPTMHPSTVQQPKSTTTTSGPKITVDGFM